MEWKSLALAELKQAELSRMAGNQGRARVCARRAAGHIVGEYLRRRNFPERDPSAYVRLQVLAALPEVSPQARTAAQHLLLRINTDHELPVDVDLIAAARWLAQELLGEPLDRDQAKPY